MKNYTLVITLSYLSLGLHTLCMAGASDRVVPMPTADTVVLEIDGVKFTLAEFEQQRPTALAKPFNTLFEGERRAISKFVDEYVLERQAEKEHLTVAELLDKHVNKAIGPDPSEEALHTVYEAMDSHQPYESLRKKILDHIREQRIEKAKIAYTQALRDQAKVEIHLQQPRADVPLGDAAIIGKANAPVMIIEYADYECPYCQQAFPTLEKVLAEYSGKVTVAYKDTPLPMHAHAEKAAEAAHCAGLQGKYAEYHDMLYTTKQLDVAQLKEDAAKLKLNTEAFDKCLDSGAQTESVKAQLREAQNLGLEGTPSFYVNGRFVSGSPTIEDWHKLIDEELAAAAARTKETAQRQ